MSSLFWLPTPQLPYPPLLPLIVPFPAAHTPPSADSADPLHVGQSSLDLMPALSQNHHVPEYEYVEPLLVVTVQDTASP